MTNYLLSVDPGKSTGIALLSYEATKPPELEGIWQFGGGMAGLDDWITPRQVEPHVGMWAAGIWLDLDDIIAEKFTARNTKGFAYTTDSLAALPCEGVLYARGMMPDYTPKEKRWVDPKFQYLVGGKDLADKKKRQHAFLEATGFYIGRTEIGETLPDYNDARSATAHGIAYLARVKKHRPAWDLIEGWASEH